MSREERSHECPKCGSPPGRRHSGLDRWWDVQRLHNLADCEYAAGVVAERDNLQRLHEAKPSIAVRCLEAERERDEYRAALAANGLLGRGAMSEALGADDE